MKSLNLLIFLICCSQQGIGQNSRAISNGKDTALQTGVYYITDSLTAFRRPINRSYSDTNHYYYINPIPILTVKNFKKIRVYTKQAQYLMMNGIELTFDEISTKSFDEATKKSVGKMLAFIIDDKLVFVPEVMSEITKGRAIILLPNRTKQELKKIKKHLQLER